MALHRKSVPLSRKLTSNQLAVCLNSWPALSQWGSHQTISGWILICEGVDAPVSWVLPNRLTINIERKKVIQHEPTLRRYYGTDPEYSDFHQRNRTRLFRWHYRGNRWYQSFFKILTGRDIHVSCAMRHRVQPLLSPLDFLCKHMFYCFYYEHIWPILQVEISTDFIKVFQ